MGIPPYSSAGEYLRWKKEYPIHEKFKWDLLKLHGYSRLDYVDERGRCIYPDKMLAPNGRTYKTTEEFRNGVGFYPSVIDENGVCWNKYLKLKELGYVDPIFDQHDFLESKGYTRHPDLDEDHFKNNMELQNYSEKHGFVPRWIDPKGNPCGQYESLDKEGYVYPFKKMENMWDLGISLPE